MLTSMLHIFNSKKCTFESKDWNFSIVFILQNENQVWESSITSTTATTKSKKVHFKAKKFSYFYVIQLQILYWFCPYKKHPQKKDSLTKLQKMFTK